MCFSIGTADSKEFTCAGHSWGLEHSVVKEEEKEAEGKRIREQRERERN